MEQTFSEKLQRRAADAADAPALTVARSDDSDVTLTNAMLWEAVAAAAGTLADLGVTAGRRIMVALDNGDRHVAISHGAWHLGASVVPLSPRLGAGERTELIARADPVLVVGDDDIEPAAVRPDAFPLTTDAPPPPAATPREGLITASGGSTGRPKLIVGPGPLAMPAAPLSATLGPAVGFRGGQTMLVAGPLYHNFSFVFCHLGLFESCHVVLMERFDAARWLALVERYAVQHAGLVPTMMRRILDVPDVDNRDLSSLEAVLHTGAPCPELVKRAWLDLVGPERLYEAYGASEGIGNAAIRGDEWLRHPGSVGRMVGGTQVRIVDDDGNPLPPGEVGRIFTLPGGGGAELLGAPAVETAADGAVAVGDLGWVDADGYLYIADRRSDLVITGGANVYPAEVEAALSSHPGVRDVAVIGLADEEWGRRVHAIIEPADPAQPPSDAELDAHCRRTLAAYKVPKSYELVDSLGRSEAGKLRRTLLRDEREPTSSAL